MHASLNPLPHPLLNHLGAFSSLQSLSEVSQVTVPLSVLRQLHNGKPYHVNIKAEGLSLMLQCINPDALADDGLWGLHGITLQAGAWTGQWPLGLKPQEATVHDLIQLLEAQPEEVMYVPPMLCLSIKGTHDQTWSVMALFDSVTQKLQTFSLFRVGPWRSLLVASAAS